MSRLPAEHAIWSCQSFLNEQIKQDEAQKSLTESIEVLSDGVVKVNVSRLPAGRVNTPDSPFLMHMYSSGPVKTHKGGKLSSC